MKKKVLYIILILSIIFPTISLAEDINLTNDSKVNADFSTLNIYSDCILLVEEDTGDVLFEKNAHEKMYPASTTKILTAIIVLEECDLDDTVTVSNSALAAVPPDYTTAKLQAGEQFSVLDVLYAMLLPSGNDAANVLAEHVSGSISAFADKMNEKAKLLGAENSHFTNPSRFA